MKRILLTAFAPLLWATGYLIITEFLANQKPLFVACMRALPMGVLMLLRYRSLPLGKWWFRAFILGALNIGVFQALLMFSAYRIPGGIITTIGAIQPLMVMVFSVLILNQKIRYSSLIFSFLGIFGVGLIVLTPVIAFDLLGVISAFGAALSMALGITLSKRWNEPPRVSRRLF